jgi:hypothetical protein
LSLCVPHNSTTSRPTNTCTPTHALNHSVSTSLLARGGTCTPLHCFIGLFFLLLLLQQQCPVITNTKRATTAQPQQCSLRRCKSFVPRIVTLPPPPSCALRPPPSLRFGILRIGVLRITPRSHAAAANTPPQTPPPHPRWHRRWWPRPLPVSTATSRGTPRERSYSRGRTTCIRWKGTQMRRRFVLRPWRRQSWTKVQKSTRLCMGSSLKTKVKTKVKTKRKRRRICPCPRRRTQMLSMLRRVVRRGRARQRLRRFA